MKDICFNRNFNPPEINSHAITTLLDLVLQLNAFTFEDSIFKQIHGTSMGTVVAPTYANIFMGWLEENLLQTFRLKPLIYLRYLDDIFIIWNHGKQLLNIFIDYANSLHKTIKFTANISESEIPFLDVLVKIESCKLVSTLYRKPTDKHQYLDYNSHHPRHCKQGIPYSQIIRLRRICSNDSDNNSRVSDLVNTLTKRNYPTNVLMDAENKSKTLVRSQVLEEKTNNVQTRSPALVTSYSTRLVKCNEILKKHFYLLKSDPKLRNLFEVPPQVVYRRNRNLKSSLMNICNRVSVTGCTPCNDKKCFTCKHIETATELRSTITGYTIKILGNFNCKSANVVYCIECRQCKIQYIGETSQEFHCRFNLYRTDILHNKNLDVIQHYTSDNHTINDMKVFIIQGNFKSNRQRQHRESFLIYKFGTIVPNGLNKSSGTLSTLPCIEK